MGSRGRAWRADAGLVVLAAGLGALFFLDARQAADHGPSALRVDLAVGAAACLALPLRRRWPVGLALVLIPTMVFSSAAMGATAVAMLGVATYRRLRTTVLVVALHAAFVLALFSLVATSRREYWQAVAVVLALDAAFVASGLLLRSQRLLVRSLRERAREAEEGQRLRIEQARHAERERIAREMHDVLAHRISLLAVHAGALEVRRDGPAGGAAGGRGHPAVRVRRAGGPAGGHRHAARRAGRRRRPAAADAGRPARR